MQRLAPAVLAILLFTSCHRREGLRLPGDAFRIVTPAPEQDVLLPPPVVHEYDRNPVTFTIPIRTSASALRREDCALGQHPFRLRLEKGRAILQLGTATEWQELLAEWDQPGNRTVETKISALLAAPELLEQRGCLPPASALRVRQLLRETLPMRPQQGLFAVYGHRVGSGAFDLRPGLRLKIVRAHFSKPPEQRKSTADGYLGLTTTSYDCTEDPAGWLTLVRSGVAFEPESMRGTIREVPQDTLRLPSRPVYRFLMHTTFLRSGVKRFAILLGSEHIAQMRELEKKLAADPAQPCAQLLAGTARTVCMPFEGDVTVSPEVQITVNGASRYVPWGSTIQNLLREVKQASNLTLRRQWAGQLRGVEAEDQAVLARTVLVGGDDVRWSSAGQ